MALYTFDYDFFHSPAVPVVEIEVGATRSTPSVTLVTLIDSGSDGTLLPKETLNRLQAQRIDTRILRTVTDVRTPVSLYRVWIRIGPYHLRNIHAIGGTAAQGIILGRDVLNQLIVTMNGLAAITEISQ